MEQGEKSDTDAGVCDANSAAMPVTLDYAGYPGENEEVQTHIGKAIILLIILPPVGAIAFFCSLMSRTHLSSQNYSAARVWGLRSSYVGIFGIALIAVCLVIAILILPLTWIAPSPFP